MTAELVSYDGAYPNLCYGTMIATINGRKVSFGYTYKENLLEENYPPFWHSTGGLAPDYSCAIGGDWAMDTAYKEDYPDDVWESLPSLISQMNEKINKPCCGGCI